MAPGCFQQLLKQVYAIASVQAIIPDLESLRHHVAAMESRCGLLRADRQIVAKLHQTSGIGPEMLHRLHRQVMQALDHGP